MDGDDCALLFCGMDGAVDAHGMGWDVHGREAWVRLRRGIYFNSAPWPLLAIRSATLGDLIFS